MVSMINVVDDTIECVCVYIVRVRVYLASYRLTVCMHGELEIVHRAVLRSEADLRG